MFANWIRLREALPHTRGASEKLLTTLLKKATRPAVEKFSTMINSKWTESDTVVAALYVDNRKIIGCEPGDTRWQFVLGCFANAAKQSKHDMFTVRFNEDCLPGMKCVGIET